MKYIFIISLMLTSCLKQEYSPSDEEVAIVNYDGCEYIYYPGLRVSSHKGNCKNPIHKCQ